MTQTLLQAVEQIEKKKAGITARYRKAREIRDKALEEILVCKREMAALSPEIRAVEDIKAALEGLEDVVSVDLTSGVQEA